MTIALNSLVSVSLTFLLSLNTAAAQGPPLSEGPSDGIFQKDDGSPIGFTAKPILPGSDGEQMLTDLIATINCIDPALAQEMEDSLTTQAGVDGKAQVVNLDAKQMEGPGGAVGSPRGLTDSNTIGLDVERYISGDQTIPQMAAVLAHEFKHFKSGKAAGKMMDPNVYGNTKAHACHHAGMVVEGVALLAQMACELVNCDGQEVSCLDIQAEIDNAQAYLNDITKLAGSGCGGEQAALDAIEMPWDCCTLCGGNPPPGGTATPPGIVY